MFEVNKQVIILEIFFPRRQINTLKSLRLIRFRTEIELPKFQVLTLLHHAVKIELIFLVLKVESENY